MPIAAASTGIAYDGCELGEADRMKKESRPCVYSPEYDVFDEEYRTWQKAVWTSGEGRTCIYSFYQIELPECFLTERITMYRIFIVEDDEIISEVLKKNLSSWGYDVSCAEDFSNIIQEFVRRDPQLVLLDLKLPFYNGFHWCEEIRRISQVPVIFISSAADNMNMVMAMSAVQMILLQNRLIWMY